MTQRRKVWLKVCVNHQFSSYSLDDVFNLKKKLDMIFITLKHFLMISHTNITYLLDHFSKRSYLRIFCWRLGRAGRPVWNWFHFFGKPFRPRKTLVSWLLAPITWRAVCPPWWLVVVHVRVVPGGIIDLLAIWCEQIRMSVGHSNWKILFLNALHWCFFITQRWCCGGRCRTCCRGARRRTAWFSPGTIVFRFSGWSGARSSSGKVFLTFLFLARQSISIRILIHLFGKSLLISQNGESGLVGQGVQCGQSLV